MDYQLLFRAYHSITACLCSTASFIVVRCPRRVHLPQAEWRSSFCALPSRTGVARYLFDRMLGRASEDQGGFSGVIYSEVRRSARPFSEDAPRPPPAGTWGLASRVLSFRDAAGLGILLPRSPSLDAAMFFEIWTLQINISDSKV